MAASSDSLALAYKVPFIMDEVQTGFGRTGTTFYMEQTGVRPDVLVMAKGIANGMPLSAVATTGEVMGRMKPGSLGGTYVQKGLGQGNALVLEFMLSFIFMYVLFSVTSESANLMDYNGPLGTFQCCLCGAISV